MQRRPTRLDTPLPGCRCPACWLPVELAPRQVTICARCFVFLTCIAPGRLQRLVPADLARLAPADRMLISNDRANMITAAANAWRSRGLATPLRRAG